MPKAGLYIDGFNLYHAMSSGEKTKRFLWLDLWKLGQKIIASGETLDRVVYFTTLATWNVGKQERHQRFIRANEDRGVEVEYGRFDPVQKRCGGACRDLYWTHEEKETDVNLATRMIRDALGGDVSVVYLLTGDSDQVPTVKTIRRLAPAVTVAPVFAPRRHSNNLERISNGKSRDLGWAIFRDCQLPNPVIVGPGVKIHCPDNWIPRS